MVAEKTKELTEKSQQAILGAIDQNGNGEVDIEDVIIMGLKVPGIRIDRTQFLQKEFQTKLPKEIIDDNAVNVLVNHMGEIIFFPYLSQLQGAHIQIILSRIVLCHLCHSV